MQVKQPAKQTYAKPPAINYELTTMAVGTLTKAFESGDGPQRDRPQDKKRYATALRNRAKAYGTYNPAILRPRVVSDRGNGVYWPLDGNGSNHWLEGLFGPSFGVPVYLLHGLSLEQENELFQQIQRGKQVTRMEKFANDREYNESSIAYQIAKIMEAEGFRTTAQVKDPWGIGATISEWIYAKRGGGGLAEVLQLIKTVFSADDWTRTNGSLLKAIASMHGNADYDHATLAAALLRVPTAGVLSEGARGRGSESIVIPRIERLYRLEQADQAAKADPQGEATMSPEEIRAAAEQALHPRDVTAEILADTPAADQPAA